MASLSTKAISGQTKLPDVFASVPTSLTNISNNKSCRIFQIVVTNNTDSGITFSAQDGAIVAIPVATIAARTLYVFSFPEGLNFQNGMSVISGNAALHMAIEGYRVS
jgi:hypothetical protein